ncbi:MAG: endonuclease, partial [Prevotella sp.]
MKHLWLLFLCFLPSTLMAQERLRIVEWNVENLFDTEHDSEKNDLEFTPNS